MMNEPLGNPREAGDGESVRFSLLVGDRIVHASISREALSDHFNSDQLPGGLVQAYVHGREKIDARARAMVADQVPYSVNRPLVIGKMDF
ncbi:MAG: DUF1488 family protein [Comamonadaceae bacterium]|nr:MAG: DUF1488 family protein [Comamonadaceae bacterium]